jgi:hypothetical protein
MGHWNYRLMQKNGQVAVHEVFYAEDGAITGYTADPVSPRADTVEELVEEFRRYERALSEPVLNFDELESERREPA